MRLSATTKGIGSTRRGYIALAATVERAGRGDVLVSKRIKQKWEKRKAVHGRAIANMLADRGRDPFDYDLPVVKEVTDFLESEIQDAKGKAFRTGRPRRSQVRGALRAGAEFLARAAYRKIVRGRLGKNPSGYRERKKRRVKSGRYTRAFGNPPPYGVATGRFVRGIRATWSQGRTR